MKRTAGSRRKGSAGSSAEAAGAGGARAPSPMEEDDKSFVAFRSDRSLSSMSTGKGGGGGGGAGGGGGGGGGEDTLKRKTQRKKLVEAILCCNNSYRNEGLAQLRMVLKEQMRVPEKEFWRRLEVYRERSREREQIVRGVVQEHVRDNRELPAHVQLQHSEPNYWWEVVRDEYDGVYYFHPNTSNVRYFYESSAGLLHHLYHVMGLQELLASEATTLADVQAFFRSQPTPDQLVAQLDAERERRRLQMMLRLTAHGRGRLAKHLAVAEAAAAEAAAAVAPFPHYAGAAAEGGAMGMDLAAGEPSVHGGAPSSYFATAPGVAVPSDESFSSYYAAAASAASPSGDSQSPSSFYQGGGDAAAFASGEVSLGVKPEAGGEGPGVPATAFFYEASSSSADGGGGGAGGQGLPLPLSMPFPPPPPPPPPPFLPAEPEAPPGPAEAASAASAASASSLPPPALATAGGGGLPRRRRSTKREAAGGVKRDAPALRMAEKPIMPWEEFFTLLRDFNPFRQPEPVAFLITTHKLDPALRGRLRAINRGESGLSGSELDEDEEEEGDDGGGKEKQGEAPPQQAAFATAGFGGAAAPAPLRLPPYECGTYSRGRKPSFKAGRSGRLYLRRLRQLGGDPLALEVDKSSFLLSEGEAEMLGRERNALVLNLMDPSRLSVRRAAGWLDVTWQHLQPFKNPTDCGNPDPSMRIYAIRSLIPEVVTPELDFLALWEGCFYSEQSEMVDVHRFAAFFDLPTEMIRFFFCEEFFCDKELVARVDYLRFMRWAARFIGGQGDFRRKMKALFYSLRGQGLSIALRDHGKELFLSQPGTYYVRYSASTAGYLTIEVKPPHSAHTSADNMSYPHGSGGGSVSSGSEAAGSFSGGVGGAGVGESGGPSSAGGAAHHTTDNFRVQVVIEDPVLQPPASSSSPPPPQAQPLPQQQQQQAGGAGDGWSTSGAPIYYDEEDGQPLPRVVYWMQHAAHGTRLSPTITRDIIPMIDQCYRRVFSQPAMQRLHPQKLRRVYRQLDTYQAANPGGLMPMSQHSRAESTVGVAAMVLPPQQQQQQQQQYVQEYERHQQRQREERQLQEAHFTDDVAAGMGMLSGDGNDDGVGGLMPPMPSGPPEAPPMTLAQHRRPRTSSEPTRRSSRISGDRPAGGQGGGGQGGGGRGISVSAGAGTGASSGGGGGGGASEAMPLFQSPSEQLQAFMLYRPLPIMTEPAAAVAAAAPAPLGAVGPSGAPSPGEAFHFGFFPAEGGQVQQHAAEVDEDAMEVGSQAGVAMAGGQQQQQQQQGAYHGGGSEEDVWGSQGWGAGGTQGSGGQGGHF